MIACRPFSSSLLTTVPHDPFRDARDLSPTSRAVAPTRQVPASGWPDTERPAQAFPLLVLSSAAMHRATCSDTAVNSSTSSGRSSGSFASAYRRNVHQYLNIPKRKDAQLAKGCGCRVDELGCGKSYSRTSILPAWLGLTKFSAVDNLGSPGKSSLL